MPVVRTQDACAPMLALTLLDGLCYKIRSRMQTSNRATVFRSSSMAEHSAVNRRVVGSSPTCGANSCLTYSRLLIPTSRYVDSPGVSGIPAEHKFEKGGFETLPFSFRDSITKICLSRHST